MWGRDIILGVSSEKLISPRLLDQVLRTAKTHLPQRCLFGFASTEWEKSCGSQQTTLQCGIEKCAGNLNKQYT